MFKKLHLPKARKFPNVFNKDQVIGLFNSIEDPEVMMAAIIGGFCGLRIGEVCKLRKQHIDLSSMQLRVTNGKLPGKTLEGYGKDRTVPIPSKVVPLLQMWMDLKKGELLFESIKCANHPLTTFHMFRKYKQALIKANLWFSDRQDASGRARARYNFHTLRHTYATMLWEKTGDIYAVKQALGHNDLETTMIYTHVSDRSLQKKVNSAFDISSIMPQNTMQLKNSFMDHNKPQLAVDNPMDLIRMRLAKGELDLESFNVLKRELITKDRNYFG